ncbi:hypothetical protein BpHYR1_045027 [Brachionus plicatilis]|uniref:MAM domain-containing protein n=1 Tax=Brachionus plicatilis TaxID=10195 RepID=A0A3M7PH82_BRAPC|nr:hypothetical protein BpHYR1_045027 [Brachionus plicatilis]
MIFLIDHQFHIDACIISIKLVQVLLTFIFGKCRDILMIVTTQLVTVTRTTAVPTMNISSDFDTLDDLNGWHTLFDKNNWIQADGVSNVILGYYGPGSDWSSINTGLKNITFTNRPLNTSCSIPYSFSVYPDKIEFYCKKVSIYQRNNLVCGLNKYPSLSYKQEIALCTQGNYLMITSDKFDSDIGSYRSRLYSPVFKLAPSQDKFCLSFKYNILTASNDGFRVYVENYLFQSEYKLVFDKRGPLVEDRWYSTEVPVTNVTFKQIIVIFFEPIRGENRDTQSSVSIDSVNLEYRECDPALVDSTTSNTQYFTTVQSTLGSKDTNTYEVSNFLNLTSHKAITTQNLIETSSKFEYSSSQKHELTSPVQSTLNDKETFSHDKTITTQNLIETSSKFDYFSSQKNDLTTTKQMVMSVENDATTYFEKQTYIDNSSQMTSPLTEQLDSTDENSYTAIYDKLKKKDIEIAFLTSIMKIFFI